MRLFRSTQSAFSLKSNLKARGKRNRKKYSLKLDVFGIEFKSLNQCIESANVSDVSCIYLQDTSGRRRSSLFLLACGDPKTRFLGCVNMAGAALKEIAAAPQSFEVVQN